MEDIYENGEDYYYCNNNEEQPTVKETTNVGESHWQAYTLPSRGFQENQNEYQELQIRPTIVHTNQYRNSSFAGATSREQPKTRSEECFEIKDNIKKLRRCMCTLSLMFAFLLLITAAAVVLAVLGFNNNRNVRVANDPSAQQGATGITEELRLNDTLSTINDNLHMLMTELTTLSLSMELTQNQLEIVRNKTGSLEAHFNESNQIISTDVDMLEARINNLQTMSQSQLTTVDNSLRSMIADLETHLQSASYQNITSLNSSVNALETHINENLNNLQTNINNLQTTYQSQLTTVDNSLRSMIADLETRLQSASYQNITSLMAMIATTNAHITNLQSSQLTTDTEISALQANQLVQPGIHTARVYIKIVRPTHEWVCCA